LRAAAGCCAALWVLELAVGELRFDIWYRGAASSVTLTITVTKGESVTVNHLFE
jgi:non-specific serine/threonine protein kinase